MSDMVPLLAHTAAGYPKATECGTAVWLHSGYATRGGRLNAMTARATGTPASGGKDNTLGGDTVSAPTTVLWAAERCGSLRWARSSFQWLKHEEASMGRNRFAQPGNGASDFGGRSLCAVSH